MPIVTLLTDFGARDNYVSEMKAVILENCPNCVLVDITHEVEPHNIMSGSFLLETAVPFYPKRVVHVAVVDPGVGSQRHPVVVECDGPVLVGPDNGLLTRAADKLGLRAVYRITTRDMIRGPVSSTFHGRDIFAPVAGQIAAGRPAKEFGPKLKGLVRLDFPEPRIGADALTCSVMHVDVFGNLITNVQNEKLARLDLREGQRLFLHTRNRRYEARFVSSYSEVEQHEYAVLIGSQGYVEVAAREANASRLLRLKPYAEFRVMWVS